MSEMADKDPKAALQEDVDTTHGVLLDIDAKYDDYWKEIHTRPEPEATALWNQYLAARAKAAKLFDSIVRDGQRLAKLKSDLEQQKQRVDDALANLQNISQSLQDLSLAVEIGAVLWGGL
jgi:chromosome segregation ATPase